MELDLKQSSSYYMADNRRNFGKYIKIASCRSETVLSEVMLGLSQFDDGKK